MESKLKEIKFNKKGLIPAVIQDYFSGAVLMLAYMNEESLKKTLETGRTWFFSRSRQELWCKGEISGNKQFVKSIAYDCDGDSLLVKVEQTGVACHTGEETCFFNMLEGEEESAQAVLDVLYRLLLKRDKERPEKSYSTELFNEGLSKIKAKVEEEAGEVLEAADEDDKKHLVEEIADLTYHLFVLMVNKKVSLDDVKEELLRRRK